MCQGGNRIRHQHSRKRPTHTPLSILLQVTTLSTFLHTNAHTGSQQNPDAHRYTCHKQGYRRPTSSSTKAPLGRSYTVAAHAQSGQAHKQKYPAASSHALHAVPIAITGTFAATEKVKRVLYEDYTALFYERYKNVDADTHHAGKSPRTT